MKKVKRVGEKKDERELPQKENKEVLWRAAEYDHSEKTLTWFVFVALISLAIAVFAFIKSNFFFGIFALFSGGMVLFFARRKPRILEFSVSEEKILIGNAVSVDYAELKNFSHRSRTGNLDEIVFRKNGLINPFVRIPIDAKLAERVKVILRKKLPEEEYDESIIDIISDYFGL